ncbi:MAG: aspartate/glutamate racemase family protein [Alphaproteobacteria bacterium]|nr:aspartate/glutamate racemase family protein [Alphaproteobacteria bacterium SS10]
MKTIGVIGGMSWESTVTYYQHLNRLVRERLGGLHSASVILNSLEFKEIADYQMAGDWDNATRLMVEAAQSLERAGADCLIIATNTMHKSADAVTAAVNIPLIHIADVTAAAIKQAGCKRPLLLATRFTMEQDFYRGHLRDHHGIEVAVPNEADRETVHRIIYEELCQGVVETFSRDAYLQVINREIAAGADGVIFGCTEIGLLLSPQDLPGDPPVTAFDTTRLHAEAAVEFALDFAHKNRSSKAISA